MRPPDDAHQGDAPLLTERLVIRPFELGDRDAAERIWHDARAEPLPPESLSWLSWNPRQLARLGQAPTGDRLVCLTSSGAPIGVAGLVCQPGPFAQLDDRGADDSAWSLEIGLYWCTHPDHRGRGYAAEAGMAMAALAGSVMRLPRVIAFTQASNTSSVRVMERMGMRIHRLRAESAPWMQVVGTLDLPPVDPAPPDGPSASSGL